MAHAAQTGILAPVPRVGRYLFFVLADAPHSAGAALTRLAPLVDGQSLVFGLGLDCVAALGATVPGLRTFPDLGAASVSVPATHCALWCWLRGDDTGDLVNLTRRVAQALAPAFHLHQVVDAFRHGQGPNGHGRDLTGYEDGTENPEGDAALEAALVQGGGPGLQGSSFVAVQQWVHDFAAFETMDSQAQDHVMGRRRIDNEELDDAPDSSHVKRTAQESFSPEAFVLRRSMPWTAGTQAGLLFVAFGHSLGAFEAQASWVAVNDYEAAMLC